MPTAAKTVVAAIAVALAIAPGAGAVFHGSRVHRGDAPWLVLMRHDGVNRCGGALVSPDRVVTAAHCVAGLDVRRERFLIGDGPIGRLRRIHARLAVIPRRYREMRSPVRPRDSDDNATVDDIALIVLARPVTGVTPIALAASRPVPGEKITAIGRGTGSPSDGDVPGAAAEVARSSATCSRIYGALFHPSRHACTSDGSSRGAQTCAGDSGSPLVVVRGGRKELASVVTWGGETHGHGCGAGLPDVSELATVHREFLTRPVAR